MFTGRFYHNLDDKGRLTVPSRYRDMLVADGAVITQGFDKNLMVLPSSGFDNIAARVKSLSLTDPEARLLRRIIFSSADLLEMDKVGRILIPHYLRQFAGLENGLVIVGVGDFFEIWAEAFWNTQEEEIQNVQENAQRFVALELTS
jgi:MraZ protein